MSVERVTVDHQVMGGVPCVRGTRIPVATVVAMLGAGKGVAEVIADYPQLTEEDVLAALRYAAVVINERELPIRFGV